MSTSYDQTIRLWDVNFDGSVIVLSPPDSNLYKASISPSGKIVAWTGRNGEICLWDAKKNHEIRRWKGTTDYISSLVFDPYEQYIATDSANSIKIWEIASGNNIMTLSRKSKSSYMDIAYSPDGKYIASVSRDTILSIWDTETWENVKSIIGESVFTKLIFSPNCKLLATSSNDSVVRLWNVSSGNLVGSFGNCNGGINSISFSPDGKQIVVASMDYEISIWDINTSTRLVDKKGITEGGYYASFNPDNSEKLISSFSIDKRMVLHRNGVIPASCRASRRSLK